MSDSRMRVPNLASKMSSDDMNALNSQLLFQDEALRFNGATPQRRVGEPGPKTRELSGFIDDKLFPVDRARFYAPQGQDFRRTMYGDPQERTESRNWNGNGSNATASGKSSDEDDDEDEDEDDEVDDDGVGDVEGLVAETIGHKSNQSGGSGLAGGKEIGNGKPKQHSPFDMRLTQDGVGKDDGRASPPENNQLGRLGNYSTAVTIAESENDMYYPFMQGAVSSSSGMKDLGVENGPGFSRRKDVSFNGDPGESLRAILSDPVTNPGVTTSHPHFTRPSSIGQNPPVSPPPKTRDALMDDAMILPCGHSFGSGGIQHVIRTKACYACSRSISEESIAPNLSLRAAVEAFRREEELQLHRSHKRRRERFDQDKNGYGDITLMDQSRGRGVQFPFSVTDRVIIKGNKRTPQRFVGREAVVTTQCLNGWYVVKTLDNAESVKLQYRSLARLGDNLPSRSKISTNWL